MNRAIHPILNSYLSVVKCIAMTFGKNCEVVLHDFSVMERSIIAIENGHVTGRSIGTPIFEEMVKDILNGDLTEDKVNYTGKSADGRILKSTTVFIKDENEKVLGCLCMNYDLTELVLSKRVLDDILKINDKEKEKQPQDKGNKVNNVLSDIVKTTLDTSGKPVAFMCKEEKVNIVKDLDVQGAFLIKGAIDYVAKVLCVSRYTIYNYLDEIRVDTK